MFNVGDMVEVCVDLPNRYPITRIGSYGVVTRADAYGCEIAFEKVAETYSYMPNHHYYISYEHLALIRDSSSAVERKIRRIYARQYRKTGQSCFL